MAVNFSLHLFVYPVEAGAPRLARRLALHLVYSYLGIMTLSGLKPVVWIASSRKDLAALPTPVRRVFGYALYLAQNGLKHDQAKPLGGFGSAGVLEVVEDFRGDAYRAVYTVRYSARVFVLHVFQKKSKTGIVTPGPDMGLIRHRLKIAERLAKELER